MQVPHLRLPSDLAGPKPVFIYGTGAAGRWMKEALEACEGVHVGGFLDTFRSGTCEGLPVLMPQALRDRPAGDYVIVIASMHGPEIIQRLGEMGILGIYDGYPYYCQEMARAEQSQGFNAAKARTQLLDFLMQGPKSRRVAVVGHRQSAAALVSSLEESPLSSMLVAHYDDEHLEAGPLNRRRDAIYHDWAVKGLFDCIILALPRNLYRETIRVLTKTLGLSAEIVIPRGVLAGCSESDGNASLIQVLPEVFGEGLSAPVVMVVPPCAGTNRFRPTMLALLAHYGWSERSYLPLMHNSHYLSRYRGASLEAPFERVAELDARMVQDSSDAAYWATRMLDRWNCAWVHDPGIDVARFADVGGPVLVLMRDPRDIINSYYFRYYTEDRVVSEEKMISLVDGVTYMGTPMYHYHWPSAKYWVDMYLSASALPNYHIVRFEDLHRDPVSTYRRLLADMGLEPNPFVSLNDEQLDGFIKLGSFEYQTGGAAVRGDDRREVVTLANGLETSCRKGVVGDWRNNFTPRVVERFKELTGDALVRLGYEKDTDWTL